MEGDKYFSSLKIQVGKALGNIRRGCYIRTVQEDSDGNRFVICKESGPFCLYSGKLQKLENTTQPVSALKYDKGIEKGAIVKECRYGENLNFFEGFFILHIKRKTESLPVRVLGALLDTSRDIRFGCRDLSSRRGVLTGETVYYCGSQNRKCKYKAIGENRTCRRPQDAITLGPLPVFDKKWLRSALKG